MQVAWHSGLMQCVVCVGVLAVLGVLFQALVFSFARCRALATAGQIFEGQGGK
jgi:hypothetical protein